MPVSWNGLTRDLEDPVSIWLSYMLCKLEKAVSWESAVAVARGLSFPLGGSFPGFLVFLYSMVVVLIVSIPRKQGDVGDIFMTLLYLKQSQWPSQTQSEGPRLQFLGGGMGLEEHMGRRHHCNCFVFFFF